MKAGRLLYKYFFKPTLPLRYNLGHFGIRGTISILAGEAAMKKAAKKEPPILLSSDEDAPAFCFLTGQKYWYQTVYCIKSLHGQLPGQFRVKLYSDGSLTAGQVTILKGFAKGLIYVGPDTVGHHLDKVLPRGQFPALRYLRDWHPFFMRMIDIHCSPGWSIHLDSDMLFFNVPEALRQAHQNKGAIYMKDLLTDSYYADKEQVLNDKFGINCLDHVNGGIVAYNSDAVDYADLEQKAGVLIEQYPAAGPARIEQTLMSYLLYKQNAVALNEGQYRIFYDENFDTPATEVVRHYIFKAKRPYLASEWKKIRH